MVRFTFSALVFGICCCLIIHCTPDDDERCGSDQTYDPKLGNCIPPDVDEDTESDTGAHDGGTDGGGNGELPAGFGDPCTETGNECQDNPEATYCAWDPSQQIGGCTIPDCKFGKGDCPSGFECCEMLMDVQMPDFCVPVEELAKSPLNSICKQ